MNFVENSKINLGNKFIAKDVRSNWVGETGNDFDGKQKPQFTFQNPGCGESDGARPQGHCAQGGMEQGEPAWLQGKVAR